MARYLPEASQNQTWGTATKTYALGVVRPYAQVPEKRYAETRFKIAYRKWAALRLRRRGTTMLCMRVSAVLLLAITTISVDVIVTPALSQITPVSPAKSVRISGRLVFPDGRPVSFGVQLSRSDDHRIEKTASAGAEGIFSFIVPAGPKYRISLGSGMKTASKVVDSASGKDIDVGDMVFENCPGRDFKLPEAPATAPMIGSLRLDQIEIESQQLPSDGKPFLSIRAPDPPPYKYVEPPQCWSGFASADHRAEWEGVGIGSLMFDRYVSIEKFVGGKVKSIHVTRHDPKLTPEQIRDEVRKVWLGTFWHAASTIGWSEGNQWNISAYVEFEDEKRTAVVMDDWIHVQVQDRAGNYWYIRLWPAVD